MKNYIIIILVFLLLIILACWVGFNRKFFTPIESVQATVMLEKVKLVTKLVSVEGQFSEIFEKKEMYQYDYFNLFSKKILVRVKAKVMIGYDFNSLNITVDSLKKTVVLNEFPHPEIISIDHDLDYYDIQEGTFNSFSTEEYNTIHKDAKNLILKKTQESDLLQTAENQKQVYIDMLTMALRSIGWNFIVRESKISDQ